MHRLLDVQLKVEELRLMSDFLETARPSRLFLIPTSPAVGYLPGSPRCLSKTTLPRMLHRQGLSKHLGLFLLPIPLDTMTPMAESVTSITMRNLITDLNLQLHIMDMDSLVMACPRSRIPECETKDIHVTLLD